LQVQVLPDAPTISMFLTVSAGGFANQPAITTYMRDRQH
jgi:hypothetical protein